jgi:hypothetical protein
VCPIELTGLIFVKVQLCSNLPMYFIFLFSFSVGVANRIKKLQ